MKVYRITHEKYASDLSGYGAFIYGGRWNEEGTYALYSSISRALALLEVLVHTPMKILKNESFVLIEIFIPDDSISLQINPEDLEVADPNVCKKVGKLFFNDRSGLAMSVPSVIIPEEQNIIINPKHPRFQMIKIVSKRSLAPDLRFF